MVQRLLRNERFASTLGRTSSHLDSLVDYLRSAYEVPEGRRISVRMTDEPSVNAHARLEAEQDGYSIDFTMGLNVWLDGLAATLASHISRDFKVAPALPLLIQSEKEDWQAHFQARLDLSSDQLPESYFGAYESFFQKTAIAVFAHEFGHIARGHLDWMQSKKGLTQLSERGLRRTPAPITTSEARYLEFDADIFAAMFTARLALEPPDFMRRWKVNTPQETLVETLLGLTLFFVSIEAEDEMLGVRAPDYPRPLLRMIVMASYMDRLWKRYYPTRDFWEEVFTSSFSVLALFEDLYPEVDLLRMLLDEKATSKLIAEANTLADGFDTTQFEIIPYAFEGDGLWEDEDD